MTSAVARVLALLVLGFAACEAPRPDSPRATTSDAQSVVVAPAGPTGFDLPSGKGAITPSFTADGEDLLYVWQEPGRASAAVDEKPTWRVRFARRHGESWSVPVDLAQGKDILANWADFPSVGVSPDGTLVAHWFRSTPDAYDFAMVRSTDQGVTWTALPVPFPAGLSGERGFLSYAAEPAGLRVFWLDGREMTGGHHGVHVGATALRSALLGPSGFLPDEVVDARTCDCCATDAVLAGGKGVVVYRDRAEDERRDISAAVAGGAGWTGGIPLGADGWVIHGCPVNGPAADARGEEVVAAWFTGSGDRQSVRAAFSGDAGATFGSAVTVVDAATDARPLGRADVLLEPDGTALVVWLSAEEEDGRVRIRRVGRDGRVGPSLELGASGTARATGFPRLAKHGSRAIVSWTVPDGENTAVTFDPALVPPVEQAEKPPTAAAAIATLPAFEAPDLSGATVSAEALRGSPVLLNVWATWCGPCRDELPALAELQRKHPSVRVLALSVDGAAAGASVRKMVEARAPTLTVLHPDASDLAGRLGVSALPRTFLYDASGTLAWSSTGALSVDDPAFLVALGGVEKP
ncbi:MAG: redoxin domain-containing protein [Myxococcota bacterium]